MDYLKMGGRTGNRSEWANRMYTIEARGWSHNTAPLITLLSSKALYMQHQQLLWIPPVPHTHGGSG